VVNRDADLARAVEVARPAGGGLQFEYVTTTSDSVLEGISPLVDGYVADGTASVAASITNNDTVAGTVSLTLLWLPTEGIA
jgi:hypothetical protein